MILTFDLDIQLHTLYPKGTVWVIYKPDWPMERENICSKNGDVGQSNCWKDKFNYHYKVPEEQGPN